MGGKKGGGGDANEEKKEEKKMGEERGKDLPLNHVLKNFLNGKIKFILTPPGLTL